MAAQIWQDQFTGTSYVCDDRWLAQVRTHISAHLGPVVRDAPSLAEAANRAADFWSRSYYSWLFPLRIGRRFADQELSAPALWPVAEQIDLAAYTGQPLRSALIDDEKLPPILPDPRYGSDGWLLAERLLINAALANMALRSVDNVPDELLHAVRLVLLTESFHDAFTDTFQQWDVVNAVLAAMAGAPTDVPAEVQEVLRGIPRRDFANRRVAVVMVALQRIKQYVFETPGLNEIRGASTLLDRLTEQLRDEVDAQLGPEVVLRAAGSVLLFLAPDTPAADLWPIHLRRSFFEQTGSAFPAAAVVRVSMQNLVADYSTTLRQVYAALEQDRARAELPSFSALPFETRCELCKTRPAEGWDPTPGEAEDIPATRRPLCPVCKTKRDIGRSERRRKLNRILHDLGPQVDLPALGVRSGDDRVADELEELVSDQARRQLLGIVYGDGNNFGAVAMAIPDMALGLQWAARVDQSTHALAALALGTATQAVTRLTKRAGDDDAALKKLPFQVLAIGGDDLSLFAWAPVAVAFAADFCRLADRELQAAGTNRLRPHDHLTFSFGVLLTDISTPVSKSVDMVEQELLKWAKQAVRERRLEQGNIALLTALTADAIPSDLARYRQTTFLRGDRGRFALCTSLRPFTALELQQLFAIAGSVVADQRLGQLQDLAGALYTARDGVLAGLLHYAYQRGRLEQRDTWPQTLEEQVAVFAVQPNPESTMFYTDPDRLPFGLRPATKEAAEQEATERGTLWFSPLGDLIELAKILS